jgi:hypothetical protein
VLAAPSAASGLATGPSLSRWLEAHASPKDTDRARQLKAVKVRRVIAQGCQGKACNSSGLSR